MAEPPAANYQLVLEKVPDDKQPETALFLSGCFSLPPASTRGIAASGPIALISDLTRIQADSILAELAPSIPAGVEIRAARENEGARISRLQWPRPPRIYGASLDEFDTDTPDIDAKCPICGGQLRITQKDGHPQLITASGEKRRGGDTVIQPRPALADKDPLFSGVKPLAHETSKFASIRSLQAGDTGFWMDHTHSIFQQPTAPEATPIHGSMHNSSPGGTSSGAKKTSSKPAAGLAAFMKPGSYAVILTRSKDPQVTKMVSEIMGITEQEARDRSLNLSLCVAREISLDEAQTLLARFQNLGAKARIVRPS